MNKPEQLTAAGLKAYCEAIIAQHDSYVVPVEHLPADNQALVLMARHTLASLDAVPIGWTDEQELRDVEKDGCGYLFKANPVTPNADPRRVILLYAAPQPLNDAERAEPQERRKADSTEPVLYVMRGDGIDFGECASTCKFVIDDLVDEWNENKEPDVPLYKTVPLYAAPNPAPGVPEKAIVGEMPFLGPSEGTYMRGWNDCRAAMLHGTDGVLTDEGTIPATQFRAVADLYGLTSPTGGETSFTFDAVEARDFIDGGWSCQEYVELGRFQEAMLQGAENAESPTAMKTAPAEKSLAEFAAQLRKGVQS
ncbi:hypothetical protein BKM35_22260 [Salmonella enterica]|nr:hypothetical protein [Salmonella enterica]